MTAPLSPSLRPLVAVAALFVGGGFATAPSLSRNPAARRSCPRRPPFVPPSPAVRAPAARRSCPRRPPFVRFFVGGGFATASRQRNRRE